MSLEETWTRYEDWRIRRSVGGHWAADLLGGILLLPIGVWLLARAASGAECETASSGVFVGALLFSLGWSSLGRAFWSRLVARLVQGAKPVA